MRKLQIVLLTFAISGCALLNPHVVPDDLDDSGTPACPAHTMDLDTALVCAYAWSNTYRGALSSQAKLRTWSGVTLIALSGLALGYGITDGSGDTLTWLGIAGGVGYGASNWLANKPAQLAYLAGMKAISCAVTIVEPLSYMPYKGSNFSTKIDVLNAAISNTERHFLTAVNARSEYKENGGDTEVLASADTQISAARLVISNAGQAHTGGVALLGKESGAGQALINTVQRISYEVDGIIVQSLPSLQALPGVIDGLAGAAGMITHQPASSFELPGTKLPTPKAELQTQNTLLQNSRASLETALLELNKSVGELRMASRPIEDNLAAAGKMTQFETLKGCGVDEEKLAPALSVSPSELQVGNSAAANRRLIVSGGRAPYMVELLESPVENLEVSQPVPFGPRVLVEVKAGVISSKYTIHITDATGASVQANLVINSTDANANTIVGTPGASNCPTVPYGKTESEKALPAQMFYKAQRVVDVDIDGEPGNETRQAICTFQKRLGLKETGELNEETQEVVEQEYGGLKNKVEGAEFSFEFSKSLTPEGVKQLQEQLGVGQTGILDAATREAIEGFSAPADVTRGEGKELTQSVVEAIIASGSGG